MERYINPEKIDFRLPYFEDDSGDAFVSLKAVKRCIAMTPTADVVPKSEVEELISENSSLAKTVNEASDLIRKLRSKLKKSKSDVAKEIFEEIETVLCHSAYPRVNANGTITTVRSHHWHIRPDDYNTIKKKYTEGE